MSTQYFDANGNPVAPVDPIASPDQQVADQSGNIINPSKEDGNLSFIKTNLDDVKTKLDTLNSKDFSTQTTLALIKTAIDAVNADIDTTTSSRASEATLLLVKANLDDVKTKLDTLNAKDFATQTTLASIKTAIDNINSNINTTLSTRASEATLSTLNSKIPVRPALISTVNSSVAPLGISGIFTGTAEDVSEYAMISVFVFANQASATDGLAVQWSIDGTNWDDDDSYTIPINKGKFFTFGPETKFFRIVYTNGVLAQTQFRLQTIFHYSAIKSSSHRLSNTISDNEDVELVKAVLTARDQNGIFQNIAVDSALSRTVLDVSAFSYRAVLSELNKLYSINIEINAATAGTENRLLYFRNPSGSNKKIYITRIFFDCITKGGQAEFRFYANPTVTANGTSDTPSSNHIGGGASASSALVTHSPTVTVLGTKLLSAGTGKDALIGSVEVDGALVLEANNSLLVTGDPDANNRIVSITVEWIEI